MAPYKKLWYIVASLAHSFLPCLCVLRAGYKSPLHSTTCWVVDLALVFVTELAVCGLWFVANVVITFTIEHTIKHIEHMAKNTKRPPPKKTGKATAALKKPATSTASKKPAPKDSRAPPTGTAHKVASQKRGYNDHVEDDSEVEDVEPPKKRSKTEKQKEREREKKKLQRGKKKSKKDNEDEDQDEDRRHTSNDEPAGSDDDQDPIDVDEEELSPTDEPPPDLTTAQRAAWIKAMKTFHESKRPNWTSEWYNYYEYVPRVEFNKGKTVYKFICKVCGGDTQRICSDSSTSNLKRHVTENCPKREGAQEQQKQTTLDEQFSKYTYGELRYLLAEWVTVCHRLDVIVEDEPFKRFVFLLNPLAKVPSADTLQRDITEMFEVSQEGLIEMLVGHEGRFNLVFNAWTSPNHSKFLGLGISFAHKGSTCRRKP
ncbi:hypothetical protein V5O48_017488 [Marasmius crinis-equi]|uniref:BED-type domain-containing protein n=1 Tax=Marasmius crinis-equi TaxID=585013 RepID=A0ABR3ENT9_9AGAR